MEFCQFGCYVVCHTLDLISYNLTAKLQQIFHSAKDFCRFLAEELT